MIITLKTINEIEGIVEKIQAVYDDGLKETVQETGKTLALIPKTINAAFAPLRQWIAQREYNVAATEKLLEEKLKNKNPNEIVTPEAYVAVPAIQAISYCMDSKELRNMFANLLATSMVASTKNDIHPSFVEVIKQLTPDEAKLLKSFQLKLHNPVFPIIDVRLSLPGGGAVTQVRNFSIVGQGICENLKNMASYLDNLDRLKLISIDDSSHIVDDWAYKKLEEQSIIKRLIDDTKNDQYKNFIQRKLFTITQYGKDFIQTCVIGNK